MCVQGLWVNISGVKTLHCNQFTNDISVYGTHLHLDKIPKSKSPRWIKIALIINDMSQQWLGEKHNFEWPPCSIHSLKRALRAWHVLLSPDPFSLSLQFDSTRSPVSSNLQYLYVLTVSTTLLAILWENRSIQKRISVSSHTWLDPHPPLSLLSVLRSNLSTCVGFQLSFSQSQGHYSSRSHFWGSCYNALGGSIRWGSQLAPVHFLIPHIYTAYEMFLTKLLKLNLIKSLNLISNIT